MSSTPAHAEIHALLAGVGDYSSSLIPDLRGPANDLAAVEALVRGEGGSDITVLRDKDVTRTSVEKAIHDLGARAKAGDWIVLYFSGHGAQAKAAKQGDEDDDLDEFLVLSGFDIEKPDAEQYIVDNDFYTWLARYVSPDVHVLHVADACHSGTLNRSIDPRAWNFTPRLAFTTRANSRGEPVVLAARPGPQFPALLAQDVTRGIDPSATVTADNLPNVIFVGAAQDAQLALEASLPVEGAPSRGLLTYSLERAFTVAGPDGKTLAADTDSDGSISTSELAAYTQSQTRTMTGQRQAPTMHFKAGSEGTDLLKEVVARPTPVTTPPAPPRPSIYAADPRARALLANGTEWRVVASAAQADFVWDFASGAVVRRSGDVVAERVTATEALRGVVEKWSAVDLLRPFLSEASLRVVVGPQVNGARYSSGARVNIGVEGQADAVAGKYLTVVNLASDGEVQLLYPLAADGAGRLTGAQRAIMETQVVQPYGADQIIAITTTQSPDELRRTLAAVDGARSAPVAANAIRQALAKDPKNAWLSIGELYTGAK